MRDQHYENSNDNYESVPESNSHTHPNADAHTTHTRAHSPELSLYASRANHLVASIEPAPRSPSNAASRWIGRLSAHHLQS